MQNMKDTMILKTGASSGCVRGIGFTDNTGNNLAPKTLATQRPDNLNTEANNYIAFLTDMGLVAMSCEMNS